MLVAEPAAPPAAEPAAPPAAEPEQAAPPAAEPAGAGVLVPAAAPAENDYAHLQPDTTGLPCWSRDPPPLPVMRRSANAFGTGLGWLKEPAHPRYKPTNPGILGHRKEAHSSKSILGTRLHAHVHQTGY